MIVLDQTIVNVALPSIRRDLGFTQSGLAWVVNAYLIAFGGLLLLAGRLGDLIGRRRVLVAGLVLFTLASLLCGLSQSQGMLIGARFAQGAAGALTSSVILGIIVTTFAHARERARAIGVYSFVASAGASIGLLAGGVLTQAINWHWIFFVNIPIGIVTAMLAVRLLDDDPGIGLREGADVVGAVLVTGALMIGVYTIVKAAEHGWVSAHTLGTGAVALALLSGFVAREATAAKPLLPLRVFQSRTVSGANVIQALMVGAMFGVFFLGSLFMQQVLGYGAVQIGLAFLPVALAIGILSLGFSERLNTRFGARRVLVPGLADRRRALPDHPRAGTGRLRPGLPAGDAPARGGGRAVVPGADVAVDVGRHAERFGARLRPGQHVAAGRRRARARRAGHAGGGAHRSPGRRRAERRRGAHRRVPPRGRPRHGLRCGRPRACGDGAAAEPGRGVRRQRRRRSSSHRGAGRREAGHRAALKGDERDETTG